MEYPLGAAEHPLRRRFQHRLFDPPAGTDPAAAEALAAMRAALALRLVERLAERDAASPAAVLVSGAAPDETADALAGAGHRVTTLASPRSPTAAVPPGRRMTVDPPVRPRFQVAARAGTAPPERLADDLLYPDEPPAATHLRGEYDAVVLLEPARPEHRLLERARALLAEGGLLLVAGAFGEEGDDGFSARRLGLVLAETGFLARDPEPIAAPEATAGGYGLWTAGRDPFAVRGYRAGDEEAIRDLFRASFHVERSRERWAWEYRDNPYGGPAISLAVDEEGAIAAHYAGYPVRFRRTDPGGPDRRLPALQVGDTMTAPKARGVGRGATSLLARTVGHFYATSCEGRVAFNYGFNTGKIQRFSMRSVGARRVGPVPYRRLELDPRASALLAAGGRGDRLFGGWRIEPEAAPDERFDRLFEAAAGAYGMLVERDARYLRWRYVECPEAVAGGAYRLWTVSHRRRLAGWGVFARNGDRLLWGDALFDPGRPEAVCRLLAAVLNDPENQGVTAIEGWLSAHPPWWDQWVTDLGFEAHPEPQDLGMVYVPFEYDPGDDFRRGLYTTMGDSDLF